MYHFRLQVKRPNQQYQSTEEKDAIKVKKTQKNRQHKIQQYNKQTHIQSPIVHTIVLWGDQGMAPQRAGSAVNGGGAVAAVPPTCQALGKRPFYVHNITYGDQGNVSLSLSAVHNSGQQICNCGLVIGLGKGWYSFLKSKYWYWYCNPFQKFILVLVLAIHFSRCIGILVSPILFKSIANNPVRTIELLHHCYHRMRGSASPVLTATHQSEADFFSGSPLDGLEVRPMTSRNPERSRS